MIIIIMIILGITVGSVLMFFAFESCGDMDWGVPVGGIMLLVSLIAFVVCSFTGFINYKKTEGVHQGVITAVDLEGVYFRRYEIYLKSSGYTNQSDESKYCLYEYETELINQLKEAIGKEVKLSYGHDGGKINWKSCGTWHLKSVEVLEVE